MQNQVEFKINVHNIDRQLQSSLNSLENSNISESNKETITKFYRDGASQKLSKERLVKYVRYPRRLAEDLKKDFDKITKDNLKDFLTKIHNKEDYSIWTKHEWEVMIKQFFTWLEYGDDYKNTARQDGYPDKVKWINCTIKKKDKPQLNKEDIPTPEEVYQLVEVANNPRDKFLISLLFETGARIEELLTLRWKDITLSAEDGLSVRITTSKTAQRETPYIIRAVPYFKMWVSSTQHKNINDPIFMNRRNNDKKDKALDYDSVRMMLQRLGKKIELKKNVNPHNFRKARASELANYLTEYQMCSYFGWVIGSPIASQYVKLNKKDLEKGLKASAGRDVKEDIAKPKLKICPFCSEECPPTARECVRCYSPLTAQDGLMKQAKLYSHIFRTEETKEAFIEDLKEDIKKELLVEMQMKKK